MQIRGYGSKTTLLREYTENQNVLHLGAVGETGGDTARRVAMAPNSVHADITRVARMCVGVDYDRPSVEDLMESGVFDNLVCADATKLTREDVPMDSIDVIVAGDILEHVPCPGDLLSAARRLAESDTLLVVTVPNALGLSIFLRHSAGRPVDGKYHLCSFNICTLTNILLETGWRPVVARSCHQKRAESSAWFHLGRTLFRVVPQWGGTLFVVCQPA